MLLFILSLLCFVCLNRSIHSCSELCMNCRRFGFEDLQKLGTWRGMPEFQQIIIIYFLLFISWPFYIVFIVTRISTYFVFLSFIFKLSLLGLGPITAHLAILSLKKMYRKYFLVSHFYWKNLILTTNCCQLVPLHGITKPTKLLAYANVTVILFSSTYSPD